MTGLLSETYIPAMRDTRDMTADNPQRKLNQEATLQLSFRGVDMIKARAATERYAISLGLGKEAVNKTALGPPPASTDLPLL